MLYTYRDTHSFSGAPGCPTSGHNEPADPNDDHFSVNCPVCEPWLVKHAGAYWKSSPFDVPLTYAEQQEAQQREKEGRVALAEFADAFMERAKAQPAPSAQPASPRRRTAKASAK